MGWNTTVIVMNEALRDIESDPEFGAKLKKAVDCLFVRSGPLDVSAGGSARAAVVIETHQADTTCLLAAGGNGAARLHMSLGWNQCDPEEQMRLLHEWADAAGYRLVKKARSGEDHERHAAAQRKETAATGA